MPAETSGKKKNRFTLRVIDRIEKTRAAYRMFYPGDSVLVGVSGGPDSMALLYALIIFAPKFHLHLGIAHVNHLLRGKDSDRDAQFVKAIAEKLNLPFYLEKADVLKHQKKHGGSLEEVARQLRYSFYFEISKRRRFKAIALGHHADDNAELLLMFMCRGSGPLGISGIPPVRRSRGRRVKIVRPLIRLTRSDIIGFLAENEIRYVSDTSNDDGTHLRNRIRQHLIPDLKKSYNPQIVDSMNRFALILRAEEDWIEEIIGPLFKKTRLTKKGDRLILSSRAISAMHMAAQRRVIRKGIETVKGDLRGIRYAHIEAAMRLLKKGPVYGAIDLPDRIRILRDSDSFLIVKEKSSLRKLRAEFSVSTPIGKPTAYEYQMLNPGSLVIKEAGMSIVFSEIGIKSLPEIRQVNNKIAFFDKDRLSFPLVIRNIRPGDRFTPLGMTGTQKVKRFFIDHKVPRSQRITCPILVSRGKIIYVVGHRIDESVKVTSSTRNILKADLFSCLMPKDD